MKFTSRDLRKLQWHLLAAVCGVVAAAGIIHYAQIRQQAAERQLRETESRHQQIATRLQEVRNEEVEIRGKAALFAQLTQAGVIGPEQRLDWTELLSSQQRQLRLPALDYEFSPQTPLEGTRSGQYSFYHSPMKLHLHLIHEEDLLRYLGGLERHARALVITRACKVSRLPPSANEREGSLAQLSADCELDWVTAHANGGK